MLAHIVKIPVCVTRSVELEVCVVILTFVREKRCIIATEELWPVMVLFDQTTGMARQTAHLMCGQRYTTRLVVTSGEKCGAKY